MTKRKVATKLNAKPAETVVVSKRFLENLWRAVADGIGIQESEREAAFKGIVKNGAITVNQKTADALVTLARRRSGGHFSSGVGYLFNDPKDVGFGRLGGGHTFKQVCESVFS